MFVRYDDGDYWVILVLVYYYPTFFTHRKPSSNFATADIVGPTVKKQITAVTWKHFWTSKHLNICWSSSAFTVQSRHVDIVTVVSLDGIEIDVFSQKIVLIL